jgi:opacity protein-like surface antigen
MKKVIISVLCFFGFVSTSFSQQKKGDVEFGFGIGYNSSTVSDSDGDSPGAIGGFNFGGSADYYFSNRWSLKGKLIYDQKGWEDLGYEFKTDYLTIPVMANWHFAKKRNWYLHFGPYVGFLLSAKEADTDIDIKDYINSTDFGLAYGIGVKIPVSDKLKLFIEYDGQGGFTDMNKDFYEIDSSISTSRSSFNVGLNFML